MSEMANVPAGPPKRLKQLPREELALFVAENVKHLLEEEALAILDNPFVTPAVCQTIAQNQRPIGFYSVRLKPSPRPQPPPPPAVSLVSSPPCPDLGRLSIDVRGPAAVRGATDTQLLPRVDKPALGERTAPARRCSSALIKVFLFDP